MCNYCYESYGLIITPYPSTSPLMEIPVSSATNTPTPTSDTVLHLDCEYEIYTGFVNTTVSLRAEENVPYPTKIRWVIDPNPLECDSSGSNTIFNTKCKNEGVTTVQIIYEYDIYPALSNTCELEILPLQ